MENTINTKQYQAVNLGALTDLIALLGLYVLAGLLLYLLPSVYLQIIVGTLSIFFAPGYALLAALYPGKNSISPGQRFAGSVGLSVVITGLLNLAVTYSVGTTINTTFVILFGWLLLTISIAAWRRLLRPSIDRFEPFSYLQNLGSQATNNASRNPFSQGISIIQILGLGLILLAAGRLIWVSGNIHPAFTEFYTLGLNQQAGNYLEEISTSAPYNTVIGIINQEGEAASYHLSYQIDEGNAIYLQKINLASKGRWESEVTVPPLQSAGVHKVTFTLQKTDEQTPKQRLYIWLNVRGS